MDFETILITTHERVQIIQLNRPAARNALNCTLLHELMAALATCDADERVGAIIITGNEKVFAAGADVKEMATATYAEMLKSDFIPAFDRLRRIKKPLIAAVSGWALGGGCELALACDMIVAAENAKFGQPEINLGVIPGAGGTQRLTHAVGKAIAMEMVLNNRTLTAQEAWHYGLVNRIVPTITCLDEAVQLAAEIAARAPFAVQFGKEAINQAFELSLTAGLAAERQAFYSLFATDDQKEGMAAFIEKRQPDWKHKCSPSANSLAPSPNSN